MLRIPAAWTRQTEDEWTGQVFQRPPQLFHTASTPKRLPTKGCGAIRTCQSFSSSNGLQQTRTCDLYRWQIFWGS